MKAKHLLVSVVGVESWVHTLYTLRNRKGKLCLQSCLLHFSGDSQPLFSHTRIHTKTGGRQECHPADAKQDKVSSGYKRRKKKIKKGCHPSSVSPLWTLVCLSVLSRPHHLIPSIDNFIYFITNPWINPLYLNLLLHCHSRCVIPMRSFGLSHDLATGWHILQPVR